MPSEGRVQTPCEHDASYGNGDGTRTCILAGCGQVFTEKPGRVQARSTLLLSPRPKGCAWLGDADRTPRCNEPPAYFLTCKFTGKETQACVTHTAIMRAEHPDWIAQVTTMPWSVHDHSITMRCHEACPRWEFVNERVSHTGECDGAEGCEGCSYA